MGNNRDRKMAARVGRLANQFPSLDKAFLTEMLMAQDGDVDAAFAILSRMTTNDEHPADFDDLRDPTSSVGPSTTESTPVDMEGASSCSPAAALSLHGLLGKSLAAEPTGTSFAIGQSEPRRATDSDVETSQSVDSRSESGGRNTSSESILSPDQEQLEPDLSSAFAEAHIDNDAAIALALQEEEGESTKMQASTRASAPNSGRWALSECSDTGLPKQSQTFAGRECLRRLRSQYPWADGVTLEQFYDIAHGNVALTLDLLKSYDPEAVSVACNPGELQADAGASSQSIAGSSGLAERLRQRDTKELMTSAVSESEELLHKRDSRLRGELLALIIQRDRLMASFRSTKNKSTSREADLVNSDAKRTWAEVLTCVRATEQYRRGFLDLHGLTADYAIELLKARIEEGGVRRVTVVTGKGLHSEGGRAVLFPRVRAFLARQEHSFSENAAGGSFVVRL